MDDLEHDREIAIKAVRPELGELRDTVDRLRAALADRYVVDRELGGAMRIGRLTSEPRQ